METESRRCKVRIEALIPCYNSERCVERALMSALAQTRPADRITIHDDASTDATPQVIARLQRLYPDVEFIRSEQNIGILASRQLLIRHSDADVLCMLDHDDAWPPEYLARVADSFGHDGVEATVAPARNVDEKGKELRQERPGLAPLLASHLHDGIRTIFLRYPVPTWSCVAIRRTSALKLLDLEGFPSGEEFPLLALALEEGNIEFPPDPFVCRHIGRANASSNAGKQCEAELAIFRWFAGRYPWLWPDLPAKITTIYANSVYLHVLAGDAAGARGMLMALLRGVCHRKIAGSLGAFVLGRRLLNWVRPLR
jgi:glycosyltransferase involved in cell wall biosynthesis